MPASPVPEKSEPEKSDPEGVFFKRVADFLPQRKVAKTKNPTTPDGFGRPLLAIFTGRFTVMDDALITGDTAVSSSARDNLVNECSNMGVICALMLDIVLTLGMESKDWLEQHRDTGGTYSFEDGWIGQQLSDTQLQQAITGLHDMSLICYVVAFVGYLSAMVVTVMVQLCAGEIGSDAGVEEFLRRIGSATRIPYLFWWYSAIFVIPIMVRYVCSCKTLPGVIILLATSLSMLVLILLAINFYVRRCVSTHNSINEFEDLHLSHSEAEEDVNTWFRHNKGGGLQDCLQDLAVHNGKIIISLDQISQQHVAMYYYKKQAETIGISLSPAELFQMAYAG